VLNAPDARPGAAADNKEKLHVSRIEKLNLVDGIVHHLVDDDHLWLGVEDGVLLVLNATEHKVMKAFVAGLTPEQVAERLCGQLGLDAKRAWNASAEMVGRLAAAGFIRGFRGYHRVNKVRTNRSARFHLTNRCQLECVHCYTGSGPYLPADDELSTERWIELVDEFADNGGNDLLFTGGEALVHRGCIDIMRRAKSRGLIVTLFSNGILIPRYVEALKECVDSIQISVDGADEGSHDHIRGTGSFQKAMRAVEVLLDAKIATRINTTLMAENWSAIQEHFPKLVARFEGTELGFRMGYGAMSHGRGEGLDQASLDPRDARNYVDNILPRLTAKENRAQLPNTVTKVTGCGYAEQLVVAPNGLVYPCHLLSGVLGHVNELPMAQIQKYLAKTADAFSVQHRQGCSTCDLRHLCGGTCRVDDEKRTGSRLITTCGPEQKLRKKRFLVTRYRPISQ
jgi:radical SAM protein with 4Fe4S-binding SPASM domain